jgi:amicyanin
MKTPIFVSIALLLVLLNAGCTQQAQNPGTNQTAGGKTIIMKNFAFDPAELKIKTGDKVVWTNKDSVPHNLISNAGNEIISPTIPVGGTYSHTFNTAGEYDYLCEIHTGMKGKIIVE